MSAPALPRRPDDAAPQQLVGFRSNEEWRDLVTQTGALLEALDDIEDERTLRAVFAALAAVDAVHREALHRLVRLFKEGVLEQVVTDPAIRTLMGMYDLLPEPEPACRKVWDFMPRPAAGAPFVAGDPAGEPPHWTPIPGDGPAADGAAVVCRMPEGSFVVAAVDEQLYAFAAVCGVHEAAMEGGRLSGLSWICPHGKGCIYDVRNGARLGGGAALDCRPVRTDPAGRILIGFGMPFAARMPVF